MNFFLKTLAVITIIIMIGIPNTRSASQSDEFGTGLIRATPQELRGIPMAHIPFSGTELPEFVDLSDNMPPPGNQGLQNSCTAWAVVYALKSYQEQIEEKIPIVQNGRIDYSRIFSPAYIFNQLNNSRNAGIGFAVALDLVSNEGVVSLADMPYSVSDITTKPTQAQKNRAKRYRIDYWRQVNVQDLKEVKAQINAGFPVLIGADVDSKFSRHPRGQTWNHVDSGGGYHAMVVVGYSNSRNAFKILNSWGSSWADDGYCWADYSHFKRVVHEGYVAKDAINSAPPTPTPRPQPNPVPPTASIMLSNVEHNTYYLNRSDLGYFIKFSGSLNIQSGLGYKNQIVVHFYYNAGGGRIGSPVQSSNPQYTDVNGYVACGTTLYDIPSHGLNTTWTTWVPYFTFNVPKGQYVSTPQGQVYQKQTSYLLAVPTLFVDNFGVAQGQTHQFTISW